MSGVATGSADTVPRAAPGTPDFGDTQVQDLQEEEEPSPEGPADSQDLTGFTQQLHDAEDVEEPSQGEMQRAQSPSNHQVARAESPDLDLPLSRALKTLEEQRGGATWRPNPVPRESRSEEANQSPKLKVSPLSSPNHTGQSGAQMAALLGHEGSDIDEHSSGRELAEETPKPVVEVPQKRERPHTGDESDAPEPKKSNAKHAVGQRMEALEKWLQQLPPIKVNFGEWVPH